MLSRVLCLILITLPAIESDFCSDKTSKRVKDFDSTRQNLISITATSCAINYFDVDSISRLTLNVIRNAKSLRILDLSSNQIDTIHTDTFSQFTKLENLKLGDNFLSEILRHYFNGLNELTFLDLSSNFIRNVDENSFMTLGSLLRLNLADNCIINLALNLPFVALDALNVSHNLIGNFPHFKNIGTIDSLDLSHNTNGILNFAIDPKFSQYEREKIAKFGMRVVQSIKSLNLANNEISNLTQLHSFISLDKLNLAGNPIDYKANVFARFVSLEKLNISNTNLKSLEAFGDFQFQQFTVLSIGQNPMQIDFNVVQKFSNLKHLNFHESFCHEFDSYREIRNNFKNLTHVSILYDTPSCKCARKNKKLFSLYHIKFSTDWHHVCSRGQIIWEGRRHNGLIHMFGLIVFQAFAKLRV